MAMASAFCCLSLRAGTFIVGWLSLVCVIFDAAVRSVALASPNPRMENRPKSGNWRSEDGFEKMISPNTYYAIYYMITVINIAVLMYLLYGTTKGRRGLMVPYLVMYGIGTAANLLLVLMELALGVDGLILMPKFIAIPIDAYFFAIVYSHYKELHSENQLPDAKHRSAPPQQTV